MKKHPQSFILASASPRRKELLTQAGYSFTIVPSDVDEKSFSAEGILPARYAEALALAKAENIARRYPNDIVIGADTIVDFNGQIIGKPADHTDARRITEMLFSRPHKVITGLAILRLSDNIKFVAHDVTAVYPKKMTVQQIESHIKGGSWADKAGAYAIQENGDEFVERIDGSLTNVMGLPMEMLERMLSKIP
jgi:septum formation protein